MHFHACKPADASLGGAGAPRIGSCGPACHGLGPVGTVSGEAPVTPRGRGTPWGRAVTPPPMSTGLAELCPGDCALRGWADMGMGSALLWRPGRPAGLHCLTFSQTCVPPTPPPAVCPLFLSGVPSPAVSTSPVPASLFWFPGCHQPRPGRASPGRGMSLPAGGAESRRGGGGGDTETGPETPRRGQRYKDGARDTETGPETPRYKDRERGRRGEIQRHTAGRQDGAQSAG